MEQSKQIAILEANAEQALDFDDTTIVVPLTLARNIVAQLEERVRELETELADWRAASKKVLNEECAPDEKHCTCVPFLRKRIDELEAIGGSG